MTINELKQKITAELLKEKCRSKWAAAVRDDSITLLENLDDSKNIPLTWGELEKILLNGACDWQQYSEGGCALIYNYDIAAHYCTKSEFAKTKEGFNNPNKYENWIDVQSRALFQASWKLKKAYEKVFSCDPSLIQLREQDALKKAALIAALI